MMDAESYLFLGGIALTLFWAVGECAINIYRQWTIPGHPDWQTTTSLSSQLILAALAVVLPVAFIVLVIWLLS